ncbi:hypothetical protein QJS04_geneDACA021026 [Acorus gramineus]|uniref:Uncharacterized protein n=1 Tax=Acorus gramineus TaxID=55184 RepID=A0AAV9B5M4_ACOGR|nr:hypothetical protein QJS04_geneDACA021026 [Acorus gramineus]
MGEKGGCGGDDVADGMLCSEHPYSGGNPGGICAFCLQEKLGKLVSSSKSSNPFSSSALLPPSSSSSSPSFRSDAQGTAVGTGSTATIARSGRSRIPFFSSHRNTNQKTTDASDAGIAVLKRSRSVAPRPSPTAFLPEAAIDSPRRRGFWSFLHLSRAKRPTSATIPKASAGKVKTQTPKRDHASTAMSVEGASEDGSGGVGGERQPSSSSASLERKVERSRSVGCGSRSFSGDFLERISTGAFGDCTLKRVESQRESKPNNYRVSSGAASGGRRRRSWGWAFESPMRVFRVTNNHKSHPPTISTATTPKFVGVPSLLTV